MTCRFSGKRTGWMLAGTAALLFCLLLPLSAQAQRAESRAGKFSLGLDIGLLGATADGTAFALGLSGDYFVTHNFSLGPLIQFGFTDDLFKVGPTLQAKYTLDLPGTPNVKFNFQGGIGFIHADLDRGPFPDRDDTSFLIPIGVGIEFDVARNISIGSSLLFNFTDLDDVRDENFFVSWLTGIRIRF